MACANWHRGLLGCRVRRLTTLDVVGETRREETALRQSRTWRAGTQFSDQYEARQDALHAFAGAREAFGINVQRRTPLRRSYALRLG